MLATLTDCMVHLLIPQVHHWLRIGAGLRDKPGRLACMRNCCREAMTAFRTRIRPAHLLAAASRGPLLLQMYTYALNIGNYQVRSPPGCLVLRCCPVTHCCFPRG